MVVGGLVRGFWVVGENCYGFVGSRCFGGLWVGFCLRFHGDSSGFWLICG